MTDPVTEPMTDPVTDEYVSRCATPHSRLRGVMRRLRRPPSISEIAWARAMHRPLFATEREVRRASDDLVRLYGLIASLPDRLFDGDLRRFCGALGMSESKTRLVTRLGGIPPAFGRADLYHDGRAFRLLELNVGSEVGGMETTGEFSRVLLGAPEFAAFAGENGLRYVDTGRVLADCLRDAAAVEDPAVALLEAPGGLADHGHSWYALGTLMRRLGLDFHVGEIDDVRVRGEELYLDGTRLDLIMRTYTADELLAGPDGEALAEPISRAHEAGTVRLWTPLGSGLFDNKGCLAMLSGHRARSAFDPGELAVVDRLLPWTRAVHGARDEVWEECLARRERLILKPSIEYSGKGVVVGWELSDREWRTALESVPASGAVVQERVVPRPEPVADLETGRVRDWRAVWGLYFTPKGHGGVYVRAAPWDEGAVIAMNTNSRTRTGCAFVY